MAGEWIDALKPPAAILGNGGATAFHILVMAIGKYLLMNLLVAVILNEFAEGDALPITARTERTERNSLDRNENARSELASESDTHPEPRWPTGYSLFLFGPRSMVRRFCRALVTKPQFDQVLAPVQCLKLVVGSCFYALPLVRTVAGHNCCYHHLFNLLGHRLSAS